MSTRLLKGYFRIVQSSVEDSLMFHYKIYNYSVSVQKPIFIRDCSINFSCNNLRVPHKFEITHHFVLPVKYLLGGSGSFIADLAPCFKRINRAFFRRHTSASLMASSSSENKFHYLHVWENAHAFPWLLAAFIIRTKFSNCPLLIWHLNRVPWQLLPPWSILIDISSRLSRVHVASTRIFNYHAHWDN